MKTTIRSVVMCVVGLAAAAPYAANAMSPAGNGVGDGEANVPFVTAGGGADEMGGGSIALGQPRGYKARGKVAGRAGGAAGRRAARAAPADPADPLDSAGAAAQTDGDQEFLQRVWTAP